MKNLFTIVAAACITLNVFAQSPDKMTYQAVIRNSSNALVANTAVGMRISILQGSIFGASVYMETQVPTSNANGLVSLEIGAGTVVTGSIAGINWANGPYFIKTETDPAGGTNYTITGTSQLLSVPYALFAKKTGFDGDSSAANEIQTLSKTGSNVTLSNGGGSVSVDDADASATNELQAITRSGNNVTLSNGGGTVSIADGDTSLWKQNGSSIYYNSGRVGLGTSNPAYPLHLVGNTTLSGGSYLGSMMDLTGGATNGNTYNALRVNLAAGGDGFHTAIRGNVTGTTTNISSGVMGICSASSFLNRGIEGSSTSTGLYNQAVFGRSDGAGDGTANTQNSGVFGYATTNANANFGVIGQADGTTTASNYGVFGAGSGGTSNYAGYFNGNVTVTGTFANPSDRKLKQNIEDMDAALPRLMALNVKTYEYVPFSNYSIYLPEGKQFGFIAQEMEVTFPELVRNQKQVMPNRDGGANSTVEYKSINYIGLIPVLTKALQEQQTRIEKLEQRIAELESKK